ncbi:MAG TPA: hypothetical protein VJ375_02615 [Gaiellaceae bacterium]|nr:hypothetical protein [Gaiellaceae bacterium]
MIDGADLHRPFAAYDSFELVVSAILRAALVQVPEAKRKGNNAVLYKRFVVEHFPEHRGYGDEAYAEQLWDFRCAFVKDKRTGPFVLIHNSPGDHLQPSADGRSMLNLESLIDDFRAAVDDLAGILRASTVMRAVAASEVALRQVTVTAPHDGSASPSLTHNPTTVRLITGGANAASGTK